MERGSTEALVGRLADTPDALAELAHVYRDPRCGTFRIFFMHGAGCRSGYARSRLAQPAELPLSGADWPSSPVSRGIDERPRPIECQVKVTKPMLTFASKRRKAIRDPLTLCRGSGAGVQPKGMHWRAYKRLVARQEAFVGFSLAGMAKKLRLLRVRLKISNPSLPAGDDCVLQIRGDRAPQGADEQAHPKRQCTYIAKLERVISHPCLAVACRRLIRPDLAFSRPGFAELDFGATGPNPHERPCARHRRRMAAVLVGKQRARHWLGRNEVQPHRPYPGPARRA